MTSTRTLRLLLMAILLVELPRMCRAQTPTAEQLVDQGRFAEARLQLRGRLDGRAILLEAMMLFREGKPRAAIEQLAPMLKSQVPSADLYKLAIVCLAALGLESETGHYARLAVQLAPDDFLTHYYLGMYQMATREPAQAVMSFRKSMALNQDYVDTYTMIGYAYEQTGQEETAEFHYRRAVELTIKKKYGKASAFLYLSRFLLARRSYVELETHLTQAVALEPRNLEAWQLLGRACTATGELDKAILALRKAVELAPEERRSHYFLMLALQQAGNKEEAEKHRAVYRRLSQDTLSQAEKVVTGKSIQ